MKNIILLSLITLLSACSNYKLEVQQGNLVTQEMISQLQRGMSKQEVQSLIGTPLLKDSFSSNRWDYVFYQKNNSKQSRNIVLYFKDNQLISITN